MLASRAPEARLITMDKGDVVKTIYESMLIDDENRQSSRIKSN